MSQPRVACSLAVALLFVTVTATGGIQLFQTGATGPLIRPADLQQTSADEALQPVVAPTQPAAPPAADEAPTLRAFQARLSRDGYLAGKLTVIDPETGRLDAPRGVFIHFVREGKVVAQVRPGEGGVFQARLDPGQYSLMAAGPDGFLVLAIRVLPFAPEAPTGRAAAPIADGPFRLVLFQQVVSGLEVEVAMVPPVDFPILKQLIRQYIPMDQDAPLPEEAPADAEPADVPQPARAPAPPLPQDAGRPNAADKAKGDGDEPATDEPTVVRSHVVQLQPDGRLVGRLRRLHPQTGRAVRVRRVSVFLIRQGRLLAQAPVDETGAFAVRDVEPGVHSIVAAGLDGFAALAVNIVQAPSETVSQADEPTGPFVPVALRRVAARRLQNGGASSLEIPLSGDFQALWQIGGQFLPGGLPGAPGFAGPPGAPGAGGAGGAGPGGAGGGGGPPGIGGGGGAFQTLATFGALAGAGALTEALNEGEPATVFEVQP